MISRGLERRVRGGVAGRAVYIKPFCSFLFCFLYRIPRYVDFASSSLLLRWYTYIF